MMCESLKPCPFCGGKAKYAVNFVHEWSMDRISGSRLIGKIFGAIPKYKKSPRGVIFCTNCEAVMWGTETQDAVDAWNTRTTENEVDEIGG